MPFLFLNDSTKLQEFCQLAKHGKPDPVYTRVADGSWTPCRFTSASTRLVLFLPERVEGASAGQLFFLGTRPQRLLRRRKSVEIVDLQAKKLTSDAPLKMLEQLLQDTAPLPTGVPPFFRGAWVRVIQRVEQFLRSQR